MRMLQFWCVLILLFGCANVYAQDNAGSSVAPALIECYNSTVLQQERRLPASLNVFIDLIRKIEDGRTALDARQLSIELIQRFRQDGIIRSSSVNSPFILPFSPTGMQAMRNRILLVDLIPGTAVNFPNELLNLNERCSMHFMLSSTVNTTIRGDEATVCNTIGRYERRARSVDSDAEVFDPENLGSDVKGNLENGEDIPSESPLEEEVEVDPTQDQSPDDVESIGTSGRAASTTQSACPVENGVVYTRWGTITAGTLIAGIAAGFEPQILNETSIGLNIDSRFAATLAGDLTEASLFQATSSLQNVGLSGGWTNTQVPRWYFISRAERYEMTDADIRAGLDGLIIARNVQAWRTRFSTIKLSQILDMYYSRRGVFNQTHSACNRYTLLNTIAPRAELTTQTSAFSARFNRVHTLPVSIPVNQIPNLSNNTVNLFLNYIPTLNDLSCRVDEAPLDRISTDIIIVLDTQWPHAIINRALSYLLDNLDINRFESNFTIISGNNASIIINSTNSVLNYHQEYNQTVHQQHPIGTQFTRLYNEVEQVIRNRMDQDRQTGNVGGRSTVVLFVPHQSPLTDEDRAFVTERREVHRSFLPDIRVLVLGLGTVDTYTALVSNPETDIFNLPASNDGTIIVDAVSRLISRIRLLQRRLINPNCGSDFSGAASSHSLLQYVEPQTVNYYRIAANYFHGEGDRILRVTGQNDGPITACVSREATHPRQNQSAGNVDCRQINANQETFVFTGTCIDGLISECGPYYFSVEAPNANPTPRCTDAGCRFPDNYRYTIDVEGFVCASGSMGILGSSILVSMLVIFLRL